MSFLADFHIKFRTGDWVEVKSAHEIAETLDASGTLDGIPFMPEMLEYCGRRFRILRRAQKTCVEVAGGDYRIREFRVNDVFFLAGLRCSGEAHDGCQRACLLFWKLAWLRKVGDGEAAVPPKPGESDTLRSMLKTLAAPGRYFCQSTELIRATTSQAIPPGRILLKCLYDVRTGAVGVFRMIWLILVPAYRKLRDKLFGRPRLLGNLTRTPVGTLGLQPGEIVEIKSMKEMQETLDRKGRNRGLVCDIELWRFCGKKDRVRNRLDRMISEPTGEMRKVEGTVLLEGNSCLCARVVGGCPRFEYCYWREVWLKRVDSTKKLGSPDLSLPEHSVKDCEAVAKK